MDVPIHIMHFGELTLTRVGMSEMCSACLEFLCQNLHLFNPFVDRFVTQRFHSWRLVSVEGLLLLWCPSLLDKLLLHLI